MTVLFFTCIFLCLHHVLFFSGPVWSAWEGFAKWTPACHTKNGTVQKEKDVSHSPDRRRRSELTLCLPFYLLVRPNYCLLRRHTGCLRYCREIASKDLCLQKCCAAHCRSRSIKYFWPILLFTIHLVALFPETFEVLFWCFWFIIDLLWVWPNCNGLLLFYHCLQQLVVTVSSHNTYTSIRCQCIGIPQYLPKHQLLSVYILELMFLHLSNQLMPLSWEDARTNSFGPEMIYNLNQAGQWRSGCAWFLYQSEQSFSLYFLEQTALQYSWRNHHEHYFFCIFFFFFAVLYCIIYDTAPTENDDLFTGCCWAVGAENPWGNPKLHWLRLPVFPASPPPTPFHFISVVY